MLPLIVEGATVSFFCLPLISAVVEPTLSLINVPDLLPVIVCVLESQSTFNPNASKIARNGTSTDPFFWMGGTWNLTISPFNSTLISGPGGGVGCSSSLSTVMPLTASSLRIFSAFASRGLLLSETFLSFGRLVKTLISWT
ncbi:hypothetical protein D3C76_1256130 [compost metagenome]